MKANELRIGNYLFAKGTEVIRFTSFFGLCNTETYPERYSSIPLTEEWLKRFGFEKDGTNYQKGWFYLHGNNKTGSVDFLLNEPYSNKYNATVLQYVHQLQNLYFALTGEELTINA
jgi:hypothetical protein